MTITKKLDRVNSYELGLYIRVISLDYTPRNNQELADLITEHFNVDCMKEDVDDYQMGYVYEDYERINREVTYEKISI